MQHRVVPCMAVLGCKHRQMCRQQTNICSATIQARKTLEQPQPLDVQTLPTLGELLHESTSWHWAGIVEESRAPNFPPFALCTRPHLYQQHFRIVPSPNAALSGNPPPGGATAAGSRHGNPGAAWVVPARWPAAAPCRSAHKQRAAVQDSLASTEVVDSASPLLALRL